MRIGRTLPPAAAPIGFREIAAGIRAHFEGARAVERLRAGIAAHFGVRHCFVVGSGKAALTLILLALKDLNPGRDEVVIPAYTCYSVPSSVLRAGLRIRLCDLGPEGLDLDPAQLAATLTPGERVLAVVPTHLYGIGADVARVRRAVDGRPIAVVEDAAQAMGEEIDGRKLGTLGDAGFFSLGRGKAFSTVEGGVIVTDRDDLAQALRERLEAVPDYGTGALLMLAVKAVAIATLTHPLLFWIPRALPFLRLGETLFERDFPIRRLSPFQAGLARDWARRLQALRESRKAMARQWLDALDEPGRARLEAPACRRRRPRAISASHPRCRAQNGAAAGERGPRPGHRAGLPALAQPAGRAEGRDPAPGLFGRRARRARARHVAQPQLRRATRRRGHPRAARRSAGADHRPAGNPAAAQQAPTPPDMRPS
jgi:perosamine synthetase